MGGIVTYGRAYVKGKGGCCLLSATWTVGGGGVLRVCGVYLWRSLRVACRVLLLRACLHLRVLWIAVSAG